MENKTTVYLIRHAQASGNIERRFQGHYNGGISEMGEIQLRYLGARFEQVRLDAVYSSPLQRALRTAQAVNRGAGLKIITDEALMEINGGGFEGVFFSDLPKRFPAEHDTWEHNPAAFVAPGGESMRSVYDRMQRAVTRMAGENPGKAIAVVSHGCAIRNFICYATGTPFSSLGKVDWCDNTAVSKFLIGPDGAPEVLYINDTSHLPPEAATFTTQDWWKLPEKTLEGANT